MLFEKLNGCDFSGEAMGRTCISPSHKFKGPCWRDHNCKVICISEGFEEGKCEGLLRKCTCVKTC